MLCPICERRIYTSRQDTVQLMVDHFLGYHTDVICNYDNDRTLFVCPCGKQFPRNTYGSVKTGGPDTLLGHWRDVVAKQRSLSRHLRPFLFLRKIADQ